MNGRIEEGELYRIDYPYKDDFRKHIGRTHVWLERIEFKYGEVYYTEDYIQIPLKEVDFMILEGSILTNY